MHSHTMNNINRLTYTEVGRHVQSLFLKELWHVQTIHGHRQIVIAWHVNRFGWSLPKQALILTNPCNSIRFIWKSRQLGDFLQTSNRSICCLKRCSISVLPRLPKLKTAPRRLPPQKGWESDDLTRWFLALRTNNWMKSSRSYRQRQKKEAFEDLNFEKVHLGLPDI